MPRPRLVDHLRAAATASSLLSSLDLCAEDAPEIENLKQEIRRAHIEALHAAERELAMPPPGRSPVRALPVHRKHFGPLVTGIAGGL